MNKTKNPTAIQSQKWIIEALILLMDKKPYETLTIKEISEKAGVDRSTFYRNFISKEDVLLSYINSTVKEYISKIHTVEDFNMQNIFKIFLVFCEENLKFIHLLRKNNLTILLLDSINLHLPEMHKLFDTRFSHKIKEEYIDVVLAFNAGGIWNLLMKCLDNSNELSLDEITKIIEEIYKFNYTD